MATVSDAIGLGNPTCGSREGFSYHMSDGRTTPPQVVGGPREGLTQRFMDGGGSSKQSPQLVSVIEMELAFNHDGIKSGKPCLSHHLDLTTAKIDKE